MSAEDTLRRNKTDIQRILCRDRVLILNKVQGKNLITKREYNNLKSINRENDEGHVVELVNKIMNKGEKTCRDFLDLLQTDEEIKETFPDLSNIQLQTQASSSHSEVFLGQDNKRPKMIPSVFTPEMQTESAEISYRFRCTGPGMFQCAETGLVFGMIQGAELLYRMVQWDESRLKQTGKEAAGPLFNIQCSEDAVRRLHFPHCETKDALSIDGLMSVVHFTDDGMSILEPLQITDTHVVVEVVEVAHLSRFGLTWDPVKRGLSLPVKGQVLLFLRPPIRGPWTLDVFLLQENVPMSEVAAQHRDSENIKISADCVLCFGRNYSVRCEQEGFKIQPERAYFDSHFGPNFHPTFEVFLTTNQDLVTLMVQDEEETEVWKRDVHLKELLSGQLMLYTD